LLDAKLAGAFTDFVGMTLATRSGGAPKFFSNQEFP
jgi:hypothetical protein